MKRTSQRRCAKLKKVIRSDPNVYDMEDREPTIGKFYDEELSTFGRQEWWRRVQCRSDTKEEESQKQKDDAGQMARLRD